MSAGGDNLEVLVHNLAVSEGQSLADLLNRCLHVQGFSGESGVRVVLRNVQGDPLTSLLLVEGEDSQRGRQVGPGSQGATVDTPDGPAIAVELPRIVVLEDNVADVGIH